jgi:Lar family restriction alleviation protein
MSDLKPCLCGSNDIGILTYEEEYHTRKVAECMDCGARGSVCDSKEEAIEAWNTRPAEDALTAKNKELIETVRGMEKTIGRAEKVLGERNLLATEVERLKADNQVYRDMLNSLLNKEVYHLDNTTMTNIKYELDNRGKDTNVPANAPDTGKMEG